MTTEIEAEAIVIDRRELEAMVEAAAERGARKVFRDLGLPLETAAEHRDAYETFLWVRRLRIAIDGASATVGKAVLTALVVGALGLIAYLLRFHVPFRQ